MPNFTGSSPPLVVLRLILVTVGACVQHDLLDDPRGVRRIHLGDLGHDYLGHFDRVVLDRLGALGPERELA